MKEDIRRIRSKSASSLPDVRLAVIGGASVGKSAISVRFLTKRFIGEYQRNVENVYRRFLEFGNNLIEYDLRDTASILDRLSIINWSTCIAVVYSITDRQSFDSAEVILDEIISLLNTEQHRIKPCITLIGNKKDLHYLREVTNDEGENLANKYKVSFAEVSASEDYVSTFTPLNSLIVESYLSVLTSRKDTKRYSIEMKSRTNSDILSTSTTSQRSSRSSLDSDLSEFDYRVFGVKYHDEEPVTVTNNTNTKDVLRKRKTSVTERKLETLDETTKAFENIGLVAEVEEDNNNNISTYCSLEVPDSGEDVIKRRSNSYSKKDKKRASLRKSTASKNQGMKKSRSYSDLKSFENEQKWEKSKSNQSLNRLEDLTKETRDGGYKTDFFGLATSLLEASKKTESSSFTKIAAFMQKENKQGWGKIRKDKKKIANMNKDGNESDRGSNNNNNNNNNNGNKFRRNENRSVRRKLSQISAMFKPKIIIEPAQ